MAGLKTIVTIIKNSDKIITAFSALGKIGGKVKGWIFSDGKFNKSRAGYLIAGGLLIGLGYAYIPEQMPVIFDRLDSWSDMIGYYEPRQA